MYINMLFEIYRLIFLQTKIIINIVNRLINFKLLMTCGQFANKIYWCKEKYIIK